jgi:hypothetical protein
LLRKNDNATFWYVGGEYPPEYEMVTAGISSIKYFDGKPSLSIDKRVAHIIALSYDIIRTQAIITIIDPNYIVACYAYPNSNIEIRDNVSRINEHILNRSALELPLNIEDFEFMVAKLCELANELLINKDVILLPDGPKPLIMAMSLIPESLNHRTGLTCQHIVRNDNHVNPINVFPTNNVYGFSINGDSNDGQKSDI